ncbi:MAG: hypothetical protein IBJ13_14580 [Sphingopyxis sp.]|nr:hypothetical protein [Sphingopyxis sp.]
MHLTPLLRRAKAMSRRTVRRMGFIRDNRATVMVEMAFCVPILALIAFGGIEMSNLTLVNTRISQIALNPAANAARIAFGSNLSLPRVREVDINDTFAGAEVQADGLDLKEHGRIVLSSLEVNRDGGQWIHWQRCYGDLPVNPKYGRQGTGATGTSFLGMGKAGNRVRAMSGTAVMFVEISYQYQPVAYGNWLGPRTIYAERAFLIREGRDLDGPDGTGVVNPSPSVTRALCPA